MRDNPFEPPRAEIGNAPGRAAPPTIVPVLAMGCIVFMLAASVLAILTGTLVEAAIVVFFCAFLWFVPVGLLRGRPWAPAAVAAAGLFVGVFALGSALIFGELGDTLTFAFRVAVGSFALLLAASMVVLRRHPFFAVHVIGEES